MKVQLGVSNRHVHLCLEDFKLLFGEDSELEVVKELVQPGQFASSSFVTIKTAKSEFSKVRVIGPIRNYTQVEISKSDAIKLGINPPVRDSGDLQNSETVEIIGPKGSIVKENCCILANRHLHITPQDRIRYGLTDVEKVVVKTSGEKSAILFDVFVKEQEKSALELHLDTDDANANLLKTGDIVEILLDK